MKTKTIFTSIKNLHLSKDKLLLILLGGVLLVIISLPVKKDAADKSKAKTAEYNQSTEKASGKTSKNTVPVTDEEYARVLEQRIEELLACADGVGKVRVMITLQNTGETVLKSDVKESTKTTASGENNTVTEISREESVIYTKDGSGSSIPYEADRLLPKIGGVLIVAQGAGDAKVVAEIMEAVEAVLGIRANKIKVMKMEG